MDGGQITALTGLLVALGSGASWLILRWDKRRSAVPRSQAATAQAAQSMTDALDVVQRSLGEDLTRVRREADEDRRKHRADRDADRARLDALDTEVQALRREVRTIRTAWADWYQSLVDRWHVHREQPAPPMPPTLDA